MATEVLVPPLGQTTDTVVLATWYKREGDPVTAGEPLFAIETDKATLDIEAPASGVLRDVSAVEGEKLEVLKCIGFIAAPDEKLPEAPATARASPTPAASTEAPLPPPPRQEKPAGGERMFVSPRARRLAEERGISLENLAGTGPEGAIVERDVRACLERQAAEGIEQPRAQASNEVLAESPLEEVRAITAAVTLTAEVDATQLVDLRQQMAEAGTAVSYDDLFLFILGRVLKEQPALNASLEGNTLRQWKRVHIGVAVDTETGVVAPVVRDVDGKSLGQLAQEASALIERAQAGRLSPEELQGATFALMNLGTFGVDTFTPIIVLPETAILGVGRIARRPAVKDKSFVIRETVWLSLAFDPRLVNETSAARFLQRVAHFVERPYSVLV